MIIKRICTFLLLILLNISLCSSVLDHSAKIMFESLYWDGHLYKETAGVYNEGKTIAKSDDYVWDINEVKEDSSHTFIVARVFLDQYLYVRSDYDIPDSGNITAVFIEGQKIADQNFCSTINTVISGYSNYDSFIFKTNNYITNYTRNIFLCYNDCPVGTKHIGFIGTINGKLVYIPNLSDKIFDENGLIKDYEVTCYVIDDESSAVISQYMF